jgi:hypothetical protein
MDLLTTYTNNSELQAITAPPLISTIHKSPQHPLSLFYPALSLPAVPWQRLLTVEILQLHALRLYLHSLPCRTLSTELCPLLLTSRRGPDRKHSSPIVAFVFFAAETCLLSICQETAAAQTTESTVLLLLLACMLWVLPSNGRCLQNHA